FFVTFDAFFAIFFGAFFAADFIVFFFLRAGAAFFADFFFVFDFFAMIVLPIHAAYNIPSAPNGKPVHTINYRPSPRSARGHGRAHDQTRPMLPKRWRTGPPGGPVDQLDRMDNRESRARGDLRHAANIASCNQIRSQSLDSPDFALAQPSCDVGLQNIVRSGRAAAQMALRHVLHREAELEQQLFRLPGNPLSVLQGARRVIGDDESVGVLARLNRQ